MGKVVDIESKRSLKNSRELDPGANVVITLIVRNRGFGVHTDAL